MQEEMYSLSLGDIATYLASLHEYGSVGVPQSATDSLAKCVLYHKYGYVLEAAIFLEGVPLLLAVFDQMKLVWPPGYTYDVYITKHTLREVEAFHAVIERADTMDLQEYEREKQSFRTALHNRAGKVINEEKIASLVEEKYPGYIEKAEKLEEKHIVSFAMVAHLAFAKMSKAQRKIITRITWLWGLTLLAILPSISIAYGLLLTGWMSLGGAVGVLVMLWIVLAIIAIMVCWVVWYEG